MGRSRKLKSQPTSYESYTGSPTAVEPIPFPVQPNYRLNYEPAPPPSLPPSSSGHGHPNVLRKPRRSSESTAHGIATGLIGSHYGPYNYEHESYEQPQSPSEFITNQFSTSPPLTETTYQEYNNYQEKPVYRSAKIRQTGPGPKATTNTIQTYRWDTGDPDLDDVLHNPDPIHDAILDRKWSVFSARGWMNIGMVLLLMCSLIFLFGGYPIYAFNNRTQIPGDGFNLGGINGSGQVPDLPAMPRLIDLDTPTSAYSKVGHDGYQYNLVFSDEFETDGRSFFPGEDPYWEAVDLHYWATANVEWYSPDAITTKDGKLVITMTEEMIKGLNFKSGMLQSWNKFCFTNGYIEMSVSLPGSPRVPGLWPAGWTMGNLGRAGYGATTEGTWPYSYDACDVGTFPNQTRRDGTPTVAVTSGNGGGQLSTLPGQKLSACTCPGSDHPGPVYSRGRSAPEIDVFEPMINTSTWIGEASQSMQAAPFNAYYQFDSRKPAAIVYNDSTTFFNDYKGGVYQQAISALSHIDPGSYGGKGYSSFAFEYYADRHSRDAGFVTWFLDDKPQWTMNAGALHADPLAEIDRRIVPEEPMYIILNLGIAPSFQEPDFKHLTFPTQMYVDYVRVYQRVGQENVGCDPPDFPTKQYIDDHINAYSNPNLTIWSQAGYTFPRNSIYDGC